MDHVTTEDPAAAPVPPRDGRTPATAPAASVSADEHGDWRVRLRDSRLGTIVVLTLTTVLVVGGAWLVTRDSGAGDVSDVDVTAAASGPPPEVGEPAQDFTATTIDGRSVSLSEFRGRPVWLLFGATWCASCRAEAPDVQEAQERYGEDVVILGLYLGEGRADVAAYADRLGLTFTHVPDPTSEISATYRVMGVPTHYFLDAEGVLQTTAIGALSPEDIDGHITPLL